MILSSMYKKVIVSALLFVVVATGLALPSFVSAQQPPAGAWWAPTQSEFNQKVNSGDASEIFGERYTQAQVYWIVYSVINLAFGDATMTCAAEGATANGGAAGMAAYQNCLVRNGVAAPESAQKQKDWGFLAVAGMADQMLSTKPASGTKYISYVAQDLFGVPEVNAQEGGFGFNALQPLQSVWAASRNAAYALMTLAVIALAFMIMFRTKISPQASVTVQSAIPRIIIGLILITFSFAVAGFIIDLAYVIQGIISALISSSTLVTEGQQALGAVELFNRINDVRTGIVSYGLITVGIVLVLVVTVGVPLSGVTGGLSVVAGVILAIIVLIVFIVALVKIFWLLLKTYVMIIFHVIALPFAALGYVAMPSSNPFLQLLRSLIGHVSVFVTVSIVVMFAHLIFWNMAGGTLTSVFANGVPGEIFNPYGSSVGSFTTGAVTASLGVPGFAGLDTSQIALFVGLVILLMAASIANNIKSLIITGRPDSRGDGLIGAGIVGGIAGGISGGVVKGAQGLIGGYFGQVGGDVWSKTGGRYIRRVAARNRLAGARRNLGPDAFTGAYKPGSSQESPMGDEE